MLSCAVFEFQYQFFRLLIICQVICCFYSKQRCCSTTDEVPAYISVSVYSSYSRACSSSWCITGPSTLGNLSPSSAFQSSFFNTGCHSSQWRLVYSGTIVNAQTFHALFSWGGFHAGTETQCAEGAKPKAQPKKTSGYPPSSHTGAEWGACGRSSSWGWRSWGIYNCWLTFSVCRKCHKVDLNQDHRRVL